MPIDKRSVEAAVVPLGHVTHGRVPCVRCVGEERGPVAGVVPGIDLFEAPDFEDIGAAVANSDGAGGILDIREAAAGVLPVINEWTVRIDPLALSAFWISAALRVAKIV